jgi:hypothetical protein
VRPTAAGPTSSVADFAARRQRRPRRRSAHWFVAGRFSSEPPRAVPSPGRSGRPGRPTRGSTPPGGPAPAGRVAPRHSTDGGDPDWRRARRDRPRRRRMGRRVRRPRWGALARSSGWMIPALSRSETGPSRAARRDRPSNRPPDRHRLPVAGRAAPPAGRASRRAASTGSARSRRSRRTCSSLR